MGLTTTELIHLISSATSFPFIFTLTLPTIQIQKLSWSLPKRWAVHDWQPTRAAEIKERGLLQLCGIAY